MSRKSEILNRTWTIDEDEDVEMVSVSSSLSSSPSPSNISSPRLFQKNKTLPSDAITTTVTADELFAKTTKERFSFIESRMDKFLRLFNYNNYESLFDEIFNENSMNQIDEDMPLTCTTDTTHTIKNRTIDIETKLIYEIDDSADDVIPFATVVPQSFDVFRNGLNGDLISKKEKNLIENMNNTKNVTPKKIGIEKRCISENDLTDIKLNDIKTSSPLRRKGQLNSESNESHVSLTSIKSFKFEDEDPFKDKVVFNMTYTSLNTDDAQLQRDILSQNMNRAENMSDGGKQVVSSNGSAGSGLNSTYSLPDECGKANEKVVADGTVIIHTSDTPEIKYGNNDKIDDGIKIESISGSISSLSSTGSTASLLSNNFKQPTLPPPQPVQQAQQISQPQVKSSIPRVLKPPTVFRSSPPATATQKSTPTPVHNSQKTFLQNPSSVQKPSSSVLKTQPPNGLALNTKRIQSPQNNTKENKINSVPTTNGVLKSASASQAQANVAKSLKPPTGLPSSRLASSIGKTATLSYGYNKYQY